MDAAHPLAADIPASVEVSTHRWELATLGLAALGVVYGDIGTSPLYAIKECFGPHHGLAPTPANVLGILSLVLWSLLLVIVLKYLTFIMQADNRGEGGILALMALLGPAAGRTPALISLGLFGAALLRRWRDHAGHLGPERHRGARGRRAAARRLRGAGHRRDPRCALHGAAARHGRRRRRLRTGHAGVVRQHRGGGNPADRRAAGGLRSGEPAARRALP